jgi:phosphoribosylamine--glycine ligase
VVKASGLALGKGVFICHTVEESENAIRAIMIDSTYGDAGYTIVIEDYLEGAEVSIHALCDGTRSVIFPATQDHKQVFDDDQGPNTGGMGVIGPVAWITEQHMQTIQTKIVEPALHGLQQNGEPFAGCLYPGIMVTHDGPKVLEYNARFGDPETQVYMLLLEADLYEVLLACATGQLDPGKVSWKPGFAACVVLASGGYPANYQKDLPITGLDEAAAMEGVIVFHAGTTKDVRGYKTAGGRVLNVTAIGDTLDQALERAYAAVKKIDFEGMQYRTDIGRRSAPAL